MNSPQLFEWHEGRGPARDREPLRVLHIAHSIAGGIASYLDEVAPFQSRRWGQRNVRFLVPAGSEHHLLNVARGQIATFARTERSFPSLLDFGRTAVRTIRRFDPDIVHLHSSFAGAIVRAMLPSGRARPRVIYCPHGWSFGMEIGRHSRTLYALAERLLARRSDLVIVNSGSERDIALAHGLSPRRLRVVRNGIAWAERSPVREGSDKIHVAFIGRHDRQKGLDLLHDAIAQDDYDHLHFHLVGARVVDTVGASAGPDRANITRYGWLSRDQVEVMLHKMDAVVMPSRWEAFGLVAIEAMRASVPVIASNRGALPELIGDGAAGHVFDLSDPGALPRLLASLDKERLRALGAKARRRWEGNYTADRMNRETVATYHEALGLAPVEDRLVARAAAAPAPVPAVSGRSHADAA